MAEIDFMDDGVRGLFKIMDKFPRLTMDQMSALVTDGTHANGRDLVFLHSLPLAVSVARSYFIPNMSPYDKVMIAVMALQKAASQWEPQRGTFPSFAITRMQWALNLYSPSQMQNNKVARDYWNVHFLLDSPLVSDNMKGATDEAISLLDQLVQKSAEVQALSPQKDFVADTFAQEDSIIIEHNLWIIWERGWKLYEKKQEEVRKTGASHWKHIKARMAHYRDTPEAYGKAKKSFSLFLEGFSYETIATKLFGEEKDKTHDAHKRQVQNWIVQPIKDYLKYSPDPQLERIGLDFLQKFTEDDKKQQAKSGAELLPRHSLCGIVNYERLLESASVAKRRTKQHHCKAHFRPEYGGFYSEFTHLREQGCNLAESIDVCSPNTMPPQEIICTPRQDPTPVQEHVHLNSIKEKIHARIRLRNEPQSSPI